MMLTQFVFYHFSFYHRFALNENPEKTWSNLFSDGGGIGCESLADEQLLLHVSFQQVVKLKKLYIGVPSDDRCPNTIKLFVNEGISATHKEGYREGRWILMDFDSIVVHIFLEEERNFYNLEELWAQAPSEEYVEKEEE